jgi:hypothetical protein
MKVRHETDHHDIGSLVDTSAPTPSDRRRALAIVSALGAIGGGAIGAILLTALQVRAPGGFHAGIDVPLGLVFGGGFGAVAGALGAPTLGWLFFRHVPLGRAMVVTGIGTVAGALVGLAVAVAPVTGGCVGFALAAMALRFHPRSA